MMIDKLERWVLDAVAEGGYSFKELWEYMAFHGIKQDELTEALKSVSRSELIEVYLLLDDDSTRLLSPIESARALLTMSDIVVRESRSRSAHYLAITKKGKKVLANVPLVGSDDARLSGTSAS